MANYAELQQLLAQMADRPAQHALVITKSDYNTLPAPTRALYVGGAGDVQVDTLGGEEKTLFSSVPAGTIIPVQVVKVWSTSTTATLIVAMW